jgi:hypothetical protein
MPVLASQMGAQKVAPTRPLPFCPPKFAESPVPANLELDRINCVRTNWVLVPTTYTPPRGSTDLEFRIRDGVVGRERRVSRVLYPLRDGDHLSGMPVPRHL